MKESTKKTILIVAVILVAGLVLTLIALTTLHKGGNSNHYEMECLTEPRQNPLTECIKE